MPITDVTSRFENQNKKTRVCENANPIGKGGFAIIIQCNNKIQKSNTHSKIPPLFILKIPLPNNYEKTDTYNAKLKSFTSEAQLCKLLKHDNIIKIYDINIKEEDIKEDLHILKMQRFRYNDYISTIFNELSPYYVTMEHINMGSLYNLLTNGAENNDINKFIKLQNDNDVVNFYNNIATTLLYGIGDAICYLHNFKSPDIPLGIVHNDIKPENIMLNYDTKNNKITAKLIDFGLSFIPKEDNTTGVSGMDIYGKNYSGTIYYTPFHLLSDKMISTIEKNQNASITKSKLILSRNNRNITRKISYFCDWFAFISVIAECFSEHTINNIKPIGKDRIAIYYQMINTLEVINKNKNNFDTLLSMLKIVEQNLYTGCIESAARCNATGVSGITKSQISVGVDKSARHVISKDDNLIITDKLEAYANIHNFFNKHKTDKEIYSNLQVDDIEYDGSAKNNASCSGLQSQCNATGATPIDKQRSKSKKSSKNSSSKSSVRQSKKKSNISIIGNNNNPFLKSTAPSHISTVLSYNPFSNSKSGKK